VALSARYLADKSALARFPVPAVGARLEPLLIEGWIATCAIVDLEALYSSRNLAHYELVLEERRSLDAAPITPEVMKSAIEFQHALARRGQHRVPIPDLIISAAARAAGLIVLHYDADFERIADVGGASHEWVVPHGSL
jgi:predicted nucleic acid-binding protein